MKEETFNEMNMYAFGFMFMMGSMSFTIAMTMGFRDWATTVVQILTFLLMVVSGFGFRTVFKEDKK